MIDFENMGLKVNNTTTTLDFKGVKIEIKNYLPINDKYDLIMVTLQKSKEDGLYNPLKMDMFFHLNLVYTYTDIVFSDEDRADEALLYDKLVSSGFMDEFLTALNDEEYTYLYTTLDDLSSDQERYKNTAAGVIQGLVNDLPSNAEAAAAIVDNFDPKQYQAVIDFAAAANGGRAIDTNTLAKND